MTLFWGIFYFLGALIGYFCGLLYWEVFEISLLYFAYQKKTFFLEIQLWLKVDFRLRKFRSESSKSILKRAQGLKNNLCSLIYKVELSALKFGFSIPWIQNCHNQTRENTE